MLDLTDPEGNPCLPLGRPDTYDAEMSTYMLTSQSLSLHNSSKNSFNGNNTVDNNNDDSESENDHNQHPAHPAHPTTDQATTGKLRVRFLFKNSHRGGGLGGGMGTGMGSGLGSGMGLGGGAGPGMRSVMDLLGEERVHFIGKVKKMKSLFFWPVMLLWLNLP